MSFKAEKNIILNYCSITDFFIACETPPVLAHATIIKPLVQRQQYREHDQITYECHGQLVTSNNSKTVNNECIMQIGGSLDWRLNSSNLPQCDRKCNIFIFLFCFMVIFFSN